MCSLWVKWTPPSPHRRASDSRCFLRRNPGDLKKREDAFGVGMPYPRVIPHSDGSGTLDAVGEGVSREWLGRRVWCYGVQSYRPSNGLPTSRGYGFRTPPEE